MTINIPLGENTYKRRRANLPEIRFINRFYEANPTDQVDGVAVIRRPGLDPFLTGLGDGPVRITYWQSGFADDDVFVVSGEELFRVHYNINAGEFESTQIAGLVGMPGTPSLAARGDYLFIADGASLQYTDGTAALSLVDVPDDNGIGSIDVLLDYIFCTVASVGTVGDAAGRFYWIEPGEVTIDPLNFATAESKPDIVRQCRAIGDQIWMLGDLSTEPWYLTGDAAAPVAPVQGRPFDRGFWPGTVLRINEEVIGIGRDGRVYSIKGAPEPISEPGIEERILNAIKRQTQGILA